MDGKNYNLTGVRSPRIGQKVIFEPLMFRWRRKGTVIGFELKGKELLYVIVRRWGLRWRAVPREIWEVPSQEQKIVRRVYTDIEW